MSVLARARYASAIIDRDRRIACPASIWYALATAGLLVLAGCESAADQQARGQEAYALYCAACHEAGQGIGPRLTATVLASRGTAARLFAYNRETMPYNAGGLLPDRQYWDITAFLLARETLMDTTRVLRPRAAERLTLSGL